MEKILHKNKIEGSIYLDDIQKIDFSMVKLKLRDKEDGLGWTQEKADYAEREYIRFLGLKRKYLDKDIVPNKDIDLFWHQHILDTQKYAEDCDVIFGYFLHHFPYFGIRDEADKKDLENAFEETKELYFQHFGESYLGMAKKCKPKHCRTACKPQKCK